MDSDGQRLPSWWYLAPAFLAFSWLICAAIPYWRATPELEFGWLVALLSGYLFSERWPSRPPTLLDWRWMHTLWTVLTVGVLLVFQSYKMALGATPAALAILALGVFSMVSLNLSYVCGRAGTRHLLPAFLFLAIALPIPGAIYDPVVAWLQGLIASCNVVVLNLLGIPAQRVGNLIHLQVGTVGIDEGCSGIRSLQSTMMAGLFIGYLLLKRNSLRFFLLTTSLGAAVFGNLVRSLFLSCKASSEGIRAVPLYHDAAGWSILGFTAVVVGVFGYGLSKLERNMENSSKSDQSPVREALTPPLGKEAEKPR